MLGISKHAYPHLWARDMWQFHRPAETLIFLWVVVLQTNLEFNRLNKLAVFLLCLCSDLSNGLSEDITLELTAVPTLRR